MFDFSGDACYTIDAETNETGRFVFIVTILQLHVVGKTPFRRGIHVPPFVSATVANSAGGRFAMRKTCKRCGELLSQQGATFCGMPCYRLSRRKTNEWRKRSDGAIEIMLTRNRWAIIDADDLEKVLEYGGWSTQYSKGYYRAARCPRIGESNPFYLMHRLIMNASPGQEVDHRNHDTLDNRRANLRLCTHQENMCNSIAKGQSKFKGVYPTAWGTWCASIMVKGKRSYLGSFDSEEHAARVYNEAAEKLHGEFANLNEL